MIHYIYAEDFHKYPALTESMFTDRAVQFKHRLNWEVSVDSRGWEVDQYDGLNPLYIIWEDQNGRHGGSIRIMPTTGRIMTNEHFLDLTGGVSITSPFIYECTRFCLAPGGGTGVAAALLAAGVEFGLRIGLEQAIGVIYEKTLPIYRRIGWVPEIIGTGGEGRERICVGVWNIDEDSRASISDRSGIPLSVMARWFDKSFDAFAPSEEYAAA